MQDNHNKDSLRGSAKVDNIDKVLEELPKDKREKRLDGTSILLKQLMMIQVAFIFYLSPQYMIASGCIDYLEAV